MKGLENYETVKERKKRFYNDHPDGRILCENFSKDPLDYAYFHVKIYKDMNDQSYGLVWSTGDALEIRDREKSVSRNGKEYESVNYTSWTENCEESAIGRALDNAGYSGNNKCSREEMEKAKRMSEIKKEKGDLGACKDQMDKFKQPENLSKFYKSLNQYEWTEDEINSLKSYYQGLYASLTEVNNGSNS